MKHAFVFPGQGSQSVGMLADLATTYPLVKQTFDHASEILGYDVWRLCQTGPAETLNQTDKAQPALLAADVAVWRVWNECGGSKPALLAGHSFGEYSALVCAGVLDFNEGIQLAQDRGQFMQAAVPLGEGAAAALIGLTSTQVIEICERVANGQVVCAANFNTPNQIVIAGHTAAVERAVAEAKIAGAKRATLLPVSVPVHCALMHPAAEQMAERLKRVVIRTPEIPVLHNIDNSTKTDADAIRQALSKQIDHPVNWVETIQIMVAQGITYIFECGPGKVLTGLNKRISEQIQTFSITDTQTLEQALQIMGIGKCTSI